MKKYAKIIFPILVILILLQGLYTFQFNEYAVVRQFGKIVRIEEGGGLKFKIPFMESVQILPKMTLFYDVPATEVTTLDKKRILVDYYITWNITDPKNMLENLRTVEASEVRLSDILYSSVRNELGKLEYGQIINAEDNNRGNIDKVVFEKINENLINNHAGIELKDIQMKRIDLPPSNEQAVYKRMISERASKAQEYLSQGESEKTRIVAETDKIVSQRMAIANAKAQSIIAEGEAEAQKIRNESFGQDPEFFNLYRTLESYKVTIKNDTVILLPINSPYLNFLKGEN